MKTETSGCRKCRRGTLVRLAALFIAGVAQGALCCGGGFVPMPYIPSSSGTINAPSSSRGSFFLIEKGASTDLFEVRKLQPLFRNIYLSGNERTREKKKAKVSGVAPDSAVAARPLSVPDSLCAVNRDNPVLNLHRIH